MRTLADIAGMLIFIGGLFFLVAGCLFLGMPGPAGGFSFWVGIGLMAVGWFISDSSNKKTCPQCAERVKYKAKKCRHCGFDFPPVPDRHWLYDSHYRENRK